MNQNLDVLRQSFCRPAVAADKETSDLFPLEKGCERENPSCESPEKAILPSGNEPLRSSSNLSR